MPQRNAFKLFIDEATRMNIPSTARVLAPTALSGLDVWDAITVVPMVGTFFLTERTCESAGL
jgi:hypothetical protein